MLRSSHSSVITQWSFTQWTWVISHHRQYHSPRKSFVSVVFASSNVDNCLMHYQQMMDTLGCLCLEHFGRRKIVIHANEFADNSNRLSLCQTFDSSVAFLKKNVSLVVMLQILQRCARMHLAPSTMNNFTTTLTLFIYYLLLEHVNWYRRLLLMSHSMSHISSKN